MRRIMMKLMATTAVVTLAACVGFASGWHSAGTLLDDFIDDLEQLEQWEDVILDDVQPVDPTLADDLREWLTTTGELIERLLALPS